MNKLMIVARYPHMAIESIQNLKILKKRMRRLHNDLDFMADYVFRLRNKISAQVRES